MSGDNVATTKRLVEASNHRDLEAILEEVDSRVEWYDAAPMLLGGEATVYRGHEGYRDLLRDLWDVFEEIQIKLSEIRDLGDRIVATGELRTRGRGSGAETESPYAAVIDFNNAKAIRVQTFLDHKEALEAAGLKE